MRVIDLAGVDGFEPEVLVSVPSRGMRVIDAGVLGYLLKQTEFPSPLGE